MEVRNAENPSTTPAYAKQPRPPSASVDSAAVSQRLQKELMSLMLAVPYFGVMPYLTVVVMNRRGGDARLRSRCLENASLKFNGILEACFKDDKDKMSTNLGVSAFPESENIFSWIGTIDGGKGTPYEGLSYKLSLHFPLEYPFKPPQVKFETSCFHPNVDQYGNICLDILQDMWSSAYDCRTVLLSIQSLLGEPNNDSPLNSYAAALWSNQEDYKRMVHKQYMEGVEPLES